MKLFQQLTPEQEMMFRHWARNNYRPFTEISGVWHPVVQDECAKINAETELESPMGLPFPNLPKEALDADTTA